MTEFVLVRHGETDWNKVDRLQGSMDIPLNDTGISQARSMASALCTQQWDVVISSPLQRAFETAVQIIDPLGFGPSDIIIDARLRERHYGAAEGLTLAERRSQWPDDIWPDAETPELMDARTGPAMRDITIQHAGKRIILVAHGSWIRSALRVLSDYNPAIMKLVIPNVSCSWVSHEGNGWQLGELGVTEHAPLID